MTETKRTRTAAQKAHDAEKARERRAARKAVEQHADDIIEERDAAEDFIANATARLTEKGTTLQADYATAAHAAADCSGGAEAHEAHVALNGECPWNEIAASIAAHPAGALAKAIMDGTVPANAALADLDSVTLYRKVKEEVAERKTNPDIATPHLDELNARKGQKVIVVGGAGRTSKRAARPQRHPLFIEAMQAKKLGLRGEGVKVTDEEMAEIVRRYHAAGVSRSEALEVIYWVDRVSRGAKRFFAVWDATIAATVEKGAAI